VEIGRKLGKAGIIALSTFLLSASMLGNGTQPASAQSASADVEYEVLSEDTQDPLMIQVAPDGRVIWTEREGALKVLLPNGKQILAGRLPVSANQCDDCVVQDSPPLEEGGLHGLLLAQDFAKSGRLYLFRSMPDSRDPKTKMGKFRLSTFVLGDDNKLKKNSEKKILEVPVEWDHCCHYGGDLEWMPDGTILLSTGDDVPATSSGGYGAREKSESWLNAELSVQNPADRRGKVLRLMPDGSVPDGSQPGIKPNPFIGESTKNPYIPDRSGNPKDHRIKFDPYIYSLGYKQPFRGAVHPPTGTAYFGDVGPDAYFPDPNKGPRGHEEINVVPPGGGVNHGWPRCIADNQPYHDYNWAKSESKGPLDCSKMTGAVLYYPHDVSDQWPVLGAGGVTSIPAAFYPASTKGALRLPERFNDKLFFLEFSRSFIATIPVQKNGKLDVSPNAIEMVTPFVMGPTPTPTSPIDATVGPDGALYFLEYGTGFYNAPGSKVSRLKCAGCVPNRGDYRGFTGAIQSPTAPAGRAQEVTGTTPLAIPLLIAGLAALATMGAARRRSLA
jgi:glucose/arabinose dehydrogenase